MKRREVKPAVNRCLQVYRQLQKLQEKRDGKQEVIMSIEAEKRACRDMIKQGCASGAMHKKVKQANEKIDKKRTEAKVCRVGMKAAHHYKTSISHPEPMMNATTAFGCRCS